jgi:hypothetical protein
MQDIHGEMPKHPQKHPPPMSPPAVRMILLWEEPSATRTKRDRRATTAVVRLNKKTRNKNNCHGETK